MKYLVRYLLLAIPCIVCLVVVSYTFAASSTPSTKSLHSPSSPIFLSSPSWPQFGFNSSHTRFNNKETLLSPSNVSQLTQAWSTSLGSTGNVGSPVVVGGTVYITSNNILDALSASTGQIIWSVNTHEPTALPPPAVANNIVYIGGTSVNAYNAKNGALIWQKSFTFPDTAPTILNGVVYMGNLGQVLALNASTGATLWYATTGGLENDSPAIANVILPGNTSATAVLYGDSYEGGVYAIKASGCNPSPCTPLWTATTGSFNDAAPLVANGSVFVPCTDGKLYAFNASTGKLRWTATTGNQILVSPAYANGVVYVGSTDGHLYAFNAKTGATLWNTSESNEFVAAPAVANGVVYIGNLNGSIYAFNAATGATLWSVATGPSGLTGALSPAIVGGVVYVGTNITGTGGKITAFK